MFMNGDSAIPWWELYIVVASAIAISHRDRFLEKPPEASFL